jgi:hypothetical protein
MKIIIGFSLAFLLSANAYAVLIPVVDGSGHDKGDSTTTYTPGASGNVGQLFNLSGITQVNPAEPATWTHNGSWQLNWQGQDIGLLTSNLGWAIADFGSQQPALGTLYIWNVQEGGAGLSRGMRDINIYYANSLASGLPPIGTDGAPTDVDFANLPEWTALGSTQTLPQGGSQSVNGILDISWASNARYIAIEAISNYGGSNGRTGLAELVFTDTIDPLAVALVPEPSTFGTLLGLLLLARLRARKK